jgi:simple sugar transport system substrate-binding protein
MKSRRWVAVLPIIALLLASCGTSTTATSGCSKQQLIIEIFHVDTGNSFSSIIGNGVKAAEADYKNAPYCVTTQFLGPEKFDMVKMVQLINAAAARNPAGLAISLPDPAAEGSAIRAAVAKGIPVITYNSGSDQFHSVGAIAHVGQDEYPAGQGHGARLAQLGVKDAICLNSEVGNVALDQRCAGIADSLAKAGATSKVLAVDLRDPVGEKNAIEAALQRDPNIDAIGGAGGGDFSVAVSAVQDRGRTGKVKIACFDTSPDIFKAIQAGSLEFASSQQQFLQGYLPIQMLAVYNQYGVLPGGFTGVIQTGPFFIDKNNVGSILKFAGKSF